MFEKIVEKMYEYFNRAFDILESLTWIFQVCSACLSCPSSTVLVPLCFNNLSLLFLCLSKQLFLGFLPFKNNFVFGQNNPRYLDWARQFNVLIHALVIIDYRVNSLWFVKNNG